MAPPNPLGEQILGKEAIFGDSGALFLNLGGFGLDLGSIWDRFWPSFLTDFALNFAPCSRFGNARPAAFLFMGLLHGMH